MKVILLIYQFINICLIIRYTEHDIYKQIKEINKNFKKVIKTNGIHIKTSSDLKREQEEMLKRVKENESR